MEDAEKAEITEIIKYLPVGALDDLINRANMFLQSSQVGDGHQQLDYCK